MILNRRILTFPILIGIFTAVISSGCNNNIGEINDVVEATHKADTEWGKNIRIVYSDSAVVRLVIHAPIMERTIEHGNNKDIFPKGILIEFMNEDHPGRKRGHHLWVWIYRQSGVYQV